MYERTGPRVFQALAIVKGLQALQKGFKLNSQYTSTNLRRTATNFTGKNYPAGKRGIQQAIDDVNTWIDETNSQLRLGQPRREEVVQ